MIRAASASASRFTLAASSEADSIPSFFILSINSCNWISIGSSFELGFKKLLQTLMHYEISYSIRVFLLLQEGHIAFCQQQVEMLHVHTSTGALSNNWTLLLATLAFYL
jgi:hypothetical protein